MKILVTGINGFVGHHLALELKSQGHLVYGVGQQPNLAADLQDIVEQYFSVDLSDASQVQKLPLTQVDAVVSLAGLADVGRSFKEPELYMRVNTAVIKNVSDALITSGKPGVRHLAISSGAIYDAAGRPPFSEGSKLDPASSPYVASKIAMEKVCDSHRAQGLDVIIARPFNHIGPGQEAGFLLPDLVAQVRHAASNPSGAIKVGNLHTRRDYTDVRDIVKAYSALVSAESIKYPVFNICSGRSVSGQQILDMVVERLAKGKELQVIVDSARVRPSDALELYGNNQRLREQTNWQPTIPLEQTIDDFISSTN